MKVSLLSGAASFFALAVAMPVSAQQASTSDGADQAQTDEIIVTATLRSENLQNVPIAVTAFTGESLEKAGVRDVKSFEAVAASFNTNSTQNESGGSTLRVRGVGTAGNNVGLESAVGIFLDGVYLSRPGVALGDLLDVQQIELLRGPQGTLFGRNTTAGAVSIRTAKPDLDAIEGFANVTYGNYDLKNIQAGVSVPLAPGNAAVRISGAWRERDGYVRNVVGDDSYDRNRHIVRGQLYFEPSSDFNIRLIADYSKFDEKCCDAIIVRDTSLVALGLYSQVGLGQTGGAPISGGQALKDYRSSNNFQSRDSTSQWGVSGEINAELGGATLTSITSYRDFDAAAHLEHDFVSATVYSNSNETSAATASSVKSGTNIKTFTQELRLAGSLWEEKFDFLVGGYYAKEKIDDIQSLTLGPDHQAYISAILLAAVPAAARPGLGSNPARNIFAGGVSSAGSNAGNNFRQSARNWSLFTNNTLNVSDRFKINFGARYSDDSKHGVFEQIQANSPACSAVLTQPLPASLAALRPVAIQLTCFPYATQVGLYSGGPREFDTRFKDNELIYTGKLLFEPFEGVNTYASFTHGYKSGGFNLDPTAAIISAANNPTGSPAFGSETVDAYELGIKAKTLDGALTANFALFRQDFKDYQVLEFTGTQFTTFNVPRVRAEGFELETILRPARNFSVSNSVTYADARYAKNCDGGVFNSVITLLCGAQLVASPKWTVVSGFDWSHDLGDTLRLGLNGNVRMESDKRTSTVPIIAVASGTGNITVPTAPGGGVNNYILAPNAIQDGTVKVNLRATIGTQDGRWALELWGNNLTNVHQRTSTFNVGMRGAATVGGGGGIGVARGSFVAEPRTYGVTARARF